MSLSLSHHISKAAMGHLEYINTVLGTTSSYDEGLKQEVPFQAVRYYHAPNSNALDGRQRGGDLLS
jgi:hypothetical protein